MSTTTINEEIQAMYMGLLDRPADASGETYWQGQLGTSTTLNAAIENGFNSAAETQYYAHDNGVSGVPITPANIANEIGNIYENLLGYTSAQVAAQIASSGSGINYWVGEYKDGMNIGQIAGTIINTVMGYSSGSAYYDQKVFLTTVADNAQTYTQENANTPYSATVSAGYFKEGQTIITAEQAAIAPTGQTYTLPADQPGYSISNPSSNNNTINLDTNSGGTSNNNISFDTINMGTTTGNVFNVYDAYGDSNLSQISSVSGVQTLNYYGSYGLQAVNGSAGTMNLSTWAGLSQANIQLNSSGANSTLTVGTGTSVDFTDNKLAGNKDTINGGDNITYVGDNATAGGSVNIGSSSALVSGTVNVTVNELSSETTNTATAVTIYGGTSDTVTANLAGAQGNTITGGTVTINGSASTTTVSVTQTPAATESSTVSGVVDGGVTINSVNSTSSTSPGTITTVTLDNFGASTVSSNVLSNLTLEGTGGVVTIDNKLSTPIVTALDLTVNNLSGTTLDDNDSVYKTLNVTVGPKNSSLTLEMADVTKETVTGSSSSVLTQTNTTMTDLSTIIIDGNVGFTSDLAALAKLSTVTANTTGITDVILTSSGATTQYATFTGVGSGQDIVYIYSDATKAITGGTASNNEIVLTNTTTTTYTHANTDANVSGFSIAGIDATLTGTSNLYNVSGNSTAILSGISTVDVMKDVASTSSTSVTFQVATDTALHIDATNTGSLIYQVMNTTGATDTASITLGTASSSGITVGALTLEDNSSTPVGIGTLHVNSIGSTSATITALTDNALSNLNLSGASGLNISTLSDASASLALTNSSSGTLTIGSTAFVDNSLTSVTLAGTGAINLTITGDTVGKDIAINGASDNAAGNTVNVSGLTTTGDNVSVSLGTGLNNDVIVANNTGTAGIDTVTFGAHTSASSSGHYDIINLSNVVNASYSTPTTTSQTSVLAGTLDVINGLSANDHIVLPTNASDYSHSSTAVASAATVIQIETNLAGTTNTSTDAYIDFAYGNYSASAGTFAYNASGPDTLMTYDAVSSTGANDFVSVVLVGVDVTSSATISTISGYPTVTVH